MVDLCFLGTLGNIPLPNRHLAALMVAYNGRKILIDCGEGTQVAIREGGLGFKNIDCICITHVHGDHIFGLFNFLTERAKITDEDKLKYPVGKSRISTVGILVFSVLMSCCAIFIMMQCLHSLLAHENAPPTTNTAVFIMLMTIFVKFCMWILYNWI